MKIPANDQQLSQSILKKRAREQLIDAVKQLILETFIHIQNQLSLEIYANHWTKSSKTTQS
jgi:hypothetical protein